MSALDLNLAAPIRAALIASDPITALLDAYLGEPAVFTRRPVPDDAPPRLLLVAPDITITDEDSLRSLRPIVTRDVFAYGAQPDDYRTTESLGYLIRGLFHRQRFAVAVPNFSVVELVCHGPRIAPTDDNMQLGRVVTLRFRLEET